ncbi:hypothetical protein [Novosphingobium sp.]|uniref:hypothetical protein n=1 Tax=Novosphingobium sp. TaxID=1874826 RepID=UPI0035B05980
MLLNRRAMIAGSAAAALLAPAAPASAIVQDRFQTLMRRVMGMTWIGTARTRSDQFVGGEFVSAIGMKFALAEDWSYRGIMMEQLNLDNSTYTGKFEISGECWTIGDDAGVSIYNMRLIEGSPLPSPYSWGPSKADMKFYNDSSRPGKFSLQGIMTSLEDGTKFTIALSNSD